MCGVGIVPSKRLFQNFTILVGQGMLQWRRLWVGLVGEFIGMFDFVGHLRIGSKNLLINLWALSTLQLGGVAQTKFVENQLEVEVLRLRILSFFLPSYSYFYPLDNGVTIKGSSKGNFFLMVCFLRSNSYNR